MSGIKRSDVCIHDEYNEVGRGTSSSEKKSLSEKKE